MQRNLILAVFAAFAAVFLIARKQQKGKVKKRRLTKEAIDKFGRAVLL